MFKRKKTNNFKVRPTALDTIKENLTTEFRNMRLNSIEMIPDLSDIILYSRSYAIKARFEDESCKLIHIKLENVEGSVFEWFVEDYDWFIKTFSFK